MKTVLFLAFCLFLFADEYPFPPDSKHVSIVMNPWGESIAVWEEKGRILFSEKPVNGNWSMPSMLSSPIAEAATPQLEIDSKGKVIINWVEGEKRKVASKPLKGEWAFKDQEDFACRSGGLNVEKKRKISAVKKNIQPLANAIDAPTSSVLSGAQIGFAPGTAAPANGLLVSGQSIFKASSTFIGGSVEIQGSDRISFGIGGTKTSTDGVVQTGIYLGPTYSPTLNTTIVANVLSFPMFSPPMGVTITTGAHILLQTGGQAGAGTVTDGYNLYVENAGFGTNRYCAYLAGPVGIGTLTPQNRLDVSGAMAIGSYAGVNTAPSNGLIVSGQVGIGTTTTGNAFVSISPSTSNLYGLNVGGAVRGVSGVDDALGNVLSVTLTGPTAGTINAVEVYVNPLFSAGAGAVNTMYGCLINAGTTTSNPTTGYGLYIFQPGYGATAYAASIQGGMVHKWITQTANYTVTTSDYYVGYSGTGSVTFTLPATPPDAGWTVIIKDESGTIGGGNVLTIGSNGNNIDGAASATISSAYGSARIYSNGTTYYLW